jgi:hypothetical protein
MAIAPVKAPELDSERYGAESAWAIVLKCIFRQEMYSGASVPGSEACSLCGFAQALPTRARPPAT